MQCLPSRIWTGKDCAEKHEEALRHGGMSNQAMPVPVVETCTHGIRSSTKGRELHMGESGEGKRISIYPGFAEYLTVVHPIYLSVQARRLFKSNTDLGTPTITYVLQFSCHLNLVKTVIAFGTTQLIVLICVLAWGLISPRYLVCI